MDWDNQIRKQLCDFHASYCQDLLLLSFDTDYSRVQTIHGKKINHRR